VEPEKAAILPQEEAIWQAEYASAITSPAELLRLLELDPAAMPLARGGLDFPLRVPRPYLARMRPRDPADPLLRQVWADAAEDRDTPGFRTDPVGDLAARHGPGLLRKYRGRTLVVVTGACAVHCRYCFRRHFPYGEAQARPREWDRTLEALAGDSELEEVILSGGDPLSLDDARLGAIVRDVAALPRVRRLRLHTRLPVVLPSRVTRALTGLLADAPVPVVTVVHANHARELDGAVAEAMSRLRGSGTLLLNQAVLLRGVNDRPEALLELSRRLLECGVLPYYLHQLDAVAWAAHFRVPDGSARALEAELRTRLPGYLVPRLVREVPGAPAKLPLQPLR
jgi:EF-P beta-lysylation protein EpmB